MTNTPILDEAVRAGCNQGCGYPDCEPTCHAHRERMERALRAALPWEPARKTIEAMALVYSTDWRCAARWMACDTANEMPR